MKNYLIWGVIVGFVVSVVAFASQASAYVAIEDTVDIYGVALKDGDVISAVDYGDPDVFIIKFAPIPSIVGFGSLPDAGSLGYKRLFLNPAIFNMYGHLGGFSKVRHVTPRIRDAFTTSGLFRNCESSDQAVWATEIVGEDSALLHHVQMSGDQAYSEDSYFFNKVFCINTREYNSYSKSQSAYNRLSDLPTYQRDGTPSQPATTAANAYESLIRAATAGDEQGVRAFFSSEGTDYVNTHPNSIGDFPNFMKTLALFSTYRQINVNQEMSNSSSRIYRMGEVLFMTASESLGTCALVFTPENGLWKLRFQTLPTTATTTVMQAIICL